MLILGLLFAIPISVGSVKEGEARVWQLGLITPYFLTGYWKLRQAFNDLARQDAEGSWLDSGGLLATAEANEVRFDQAVPGKHMVEVIAPITPVLFVLTSMAFLASPLLTFSRLGRLALAGLIVAFHMFNWWALQARFLLAAVLIFAALVPGDWKFRRSPRLESRLLAKEAKPASACSSQR